MDLTGLKENGEEQTDEAEEEHKDKLTNGGHKKLNILKKITNKKKT